MSTESTTAETAKDRSRRDLEAAMRLCDETAAYCGGGEGQ